MDVLVPIDGSPVSDRAVEFAVEFADRYDARLDVVHVSDRETDATREVVASATERLEAAGVAATPEVVVPEGLGTRTSAAIGDAILGPVEERGADHVVMGHDEGGAVEELMLGSAAQTVLGETEVPVTVVV